MGEFQYSRYPAEHWEEEILKMKAGGIRVVSTYIFWIHHEEIEGQFDWSGRRDLHRFVQLAGKHGMYVWARVGPWDHGEVRNGGFPDWLLQKSKTRQNDPSIQVRRRFYGEIGRQLAGLFWKDGGPSSASRSKTSTTRADLPKARVIFSRYGKWRAKGNRRPVLFHNRMGRRRDPRARSHSRIRRLSRRILVPAASAERSSNRPRPNRSAV